jgi:hypothetical protein
MGRGPAKTENWKNAAKTKRSERSWGRARELDLKSNIVSLLDGKMIYAEIPKKIGGGLEGRNFDYSKGALDEKQKNNDTDR